MRKNLPYLINFLIVALILQACEKDPPNPFDPYNQPDGDSTNVIVDPASIEGLHKNIFKPVCANSGCHDGNFEPDFRTIESAYNTLVYHPMIKNDLDDPVDYRVEPGNHNRSILYRRLTKDLGGNSGIMPLLVDPDSDWEEKKDTYIENIKDWIDAGAKDILGNPATVVNMQPQMTGFAAKKPGSNPIFNRSFNNGAILIPFGEPQIEFYFGLNDQETPASGISVLKLQLSKSRDNFSNAQEFTFVELNTYQQETGYSGQLVDYQFKAVVDDPNVYWDPGETAFARIIVQDPQHAEPTMIPSRYSADHIKTYFSIQLQ